MTPWPSVPLADLVGLVDAGTWGVDPKDGGGAPVVRSSDIDGFGLHLEGCARRQVPGHHTVSKQLADGDILVSLSSGSPEHFGKCCIFRQPASGEHHYFSNFMIRLRVRETIVDPRWPFYWLSSPRGRTLLSAMQHSSGRRRYLKREFYLGQTVPLASLAEQRRIASILDTADSVRRRTHEAIFLADAFLRAAFLSRFGDPVTNPMGLPTRALDRLCTIWVGNTPSRALPDYYGDGIEWIKSDNINTPSHILTPAAECLSPEGRLIGRIAAADSTLMTCIAGSSGCIGNVAFADRAVAFNQQICALTPQSGTDPHFLYVALWLVKPRVQRVSTHYVKEMVTKARLSAVEIPVPSLRLQRTFGRLVREVFATRQRLTTAAALADRLFDSLVQRAFRGGL